MSDAQKARMANSAAWVNKKDLERRAMRMLDSVDCPWVSVVSSTGGPSTESSWVCEFYFCNPQLVGWTPYCSSQGKINGCQIIKKVAKDKRPESATDFLKMRRKQIAMKWHVKIVESNQGWFEYRPDLCHGSEPGPDMAERALEGGE